MENLTIQTEVYVQATAFDKNSNDSVGIMIIAKTKEDFNIQFEEFIASIPFTRYYTTLVNNHILTSDQEFILSDYELD